MEGHTSDNHPLCTDKATASWSRNNPSRSSRQNLSSSVRTSLCSPAHSLPQIHWDLQSEPATPHSRFHYLHKHAWTCATRITPTKCLLIFSRILTVSGEELPEVYGDNNPSAEVVPIAPQADSHGARARLTVHATEVKWVTGEVICLPALPFICWKPEREEKSLM